MLPSGNTLPLVAVQIVCLIPEASETVTLVAKETEAPVEAVALAVMFEQVMFGGVTSKIVTLNVHELEILP